MEAIFQISSINRINLGVTDQVNVWDDETSKKNIQTKLGVIFKRNLEPKLKDFVIKVVLQYDPAPNT